MKEFDLLSIQVSLVSLTFSQLSRPSHHTTLLNAPLVPDNEYYNGYDIILSTYTWFGNEIYAILTDMRMISPQQAPLAMRHN